MSDLWDQPFESCSCRKPFCSCGGTMKDAEPYLEKFVKAGGFMTVFEWGPGRSTRIFLRSCGFVEAVESEARWIPDLAGNDASRFICHLVPLSSDLYPFLWENKDADFYFVDGRRRADCILSVLGGADDPVLGIHDAQRTRYHEAMRRWPYVVFITRGLAILSKDSRWADVARGCR